MTWPDTPELMAKALKLLDAEIYDPVTAIYSAPIDQDPRYSIHILEQTPTNSGFTVLQAREFDLFNTMTRAYHT